MRYIDKIIIHCSATQEGIQFSVKDIDTWHRDRGFSMVGYHYVIYLDGTVHEGRPISMIGAHCLGQNTASIGICYIGGLDRTNRPKDTRTLKQKQAIESLISDLQKEYPNTTIHGHNEFANKACPCFDVQNEFCK